jgi:hypothetical protein
MKPHLLLPFILLPGISSCKKEAPTASTAASTSEHVDTPTTTPPQAPPFITLIYQISDLDMKEKTELPPDENDPFAGLGGPKYPSQQLAEAGLPLPKGASATRTGPKFILKAPQSYHDQVATLLDVKGSSSPPQSDDTVTKPAE